MDPEIIRMQSQYQEIMGAMRTGRIDEYQAANGIGNLVAVDREGRAWTMSLEGKFFSSHPGEVPREADADEFVGDGVMDGPETQVPAE